MEAAQKRFNEIKDRQDYTLREDEMNSLGYMLLRSGKTQEAIEIFKLNVQEFPDSWNVYDSLGEAYMTAGNTQLAIENYEKSVEMNPQNTNGKDILEQLKAKAE
ncbi:MAG: tetratricopeptide repeat protein, partial [Salegentibacter sp.]